MLSAIEDDLAAGRLGLGDRLPGERALAERLGVSRPSVREAIRVLEAHGVVRTGPGSGPEAGAVLVADPAAGLGAALRLHVATNGVAVADVVGMRLLIEEWGMREAAARRPDAAALAAAQHALTAMDDPALDRERFLDLDAQFHAALVGLAGNVLVTVVMTSLRGAVRGYIGEGARRLPAWAAVADRLRAEHHRIFDAVRAGRAEEAARVTRAHIEGFHRLTR
ncbi:GntR family transcriptional regulator [Pseudonocardia sp. CNS-139]|nr:GntR family transcriptional regulator [Pseudonocardia sp. CNS-139]